MASTSAQIVRAKDGTECVVLDLAAFQALLDAASVAESGLPDTKLIIGELKSALASEGAYIDAQDFIDQYDAAHRAG